MTLSRRHFIGFTATSLALVAAPALADTARKGTFSGRKGYGASGTVTVSADTVELGSDFSFKGNPPDIKIGFGNGEKYAKGSKIHNKLSVKQGAASFPIPAGIDTSKFSEVYIYCEQFSVILAVAPLR